jgi:hypothetical protein
MNPCATCTRTGRHEKIASRMMDLHNDNNVYILGAGFSMPAGIPGVRGFLNKVRDARSWLKNSGKPGELEAVERLLTFRHECSGASDRTRIDLENIEDLFSLAAADAGPIATKYLPLAMAATIRFSLATAPKTTRSIDVKPQLFAGSGPPRGWEMVGGGRFAVPLYDLLVGLMTGALTDDHPGSDTVITFNYDLLVEEAAHRLGLGIDYQLPANTAFTDSDAMAARRGDRNVTILKLHGSCNWSLGDDGKSISVHGSYDALRAVEKTPHLIPPTWQKGFADVEGHVWSSAVSALRTATRVFVIGFSIPPSDLHFRYLLAAGLRSNSSLRSIVFVNPDDSVKERCFRVLREDLHGNGVLSFQEGQYAHCEEFLLDPENISRPINPWCSIWR